MHHSLLAGMGQKLEITGKKFHEKSHTLPQEKQFLSTARSVLTTKLKLVNQISSRKEYILSFTF